MPSLAAFFWLAFGSSALAAGRAVARDGR